MNLDSPRFYVSSTKSIEAIPSASTPTNLNAPLSEFWTLSWDSKGPIITSTAEGVNLDHRRLARGESGAISHRSLIIDPNRQAFIYLDRDDPALRTIEDLRRFMIARLMRGADDVRTQGLASGHSPNFPELSGRFSLAQGRNIIGRDEQSAIVLHSPLVSRQHAVVHWDGKNVTLTDLQSFNGTFRDGERITRPTTLATGDRIDIGPFQLAFGGDHFVTVVEGAAEVTIDGVSFSAHTPEGEKTILRDVHLAIRPREFVAIIGSSGCGKSILTKITAGRIDPTSGAVYLDRESLHANFEAFQRRIAYVPQRDVLHDSLTLDETLDYAVRLRMPGDLTEAERKAEIDRTLEQVGLLPHRKTLIGRLSGGQARRATLAIELLSRPQLLLLDEATTGLDEEIDGELMALFRKLANDGVTVVCVTHHLGNVAKQCDRVAILTPAFAPGKGGQLAFFGPPEEAAAFFGVASLGEIYPRLRDPKVDSWSATFAASETYDRQVRQRTPLYLSNRARSGTGARKNFVQRFTKGCRQAWLLLSRSAMVKRAQVSWMGLMAAQAMGLAILLSWLFGDLTKVTLSKDEEAGMQKVSRRMADEIISEQEAATIKAMVPASKIKEKREKSESRMREQWIAQKRGSLLLRLTVSLVMCALWLGCNNASSEIVRERMLFEAEREVGVSSLAYLTSKVLLLGAVVIAQSTILFFGVRWGTGYTGPLFWQLAMVWATTAVGASIGLAISAWSKSIDVSTALVPIAVIPQILFAGTLVPLEGEKQFLADWLAPMHWSYRGMVYLLNFTSDERELLAMVGSLPSYPASDGTRALITLGVHGLFFLTIAWAGLVGVDRLKLTFWKRTK